MTLIEWLLLGGVAISAFMVGKSYDRRRQEEIIEDTIDTLIAQRYIRYKIVDGEEVLLKNHED